MHPALVELEIRVHARRKFCTRAVFGVLHAPFVEVVLRVRETARGPAVAGGLGEAELGLAAADVEREIRRRLVVGAVVEIDNVGPDLLDIKIQADVFIHVPAQIRGEILGRVGLRRGARLDVESHATRGRTRLVARGGPRVTRPVRAGAGARHVAIRMRNRRIVGSTCPAVTYVVDDAAHEYATAVEFVGRCAGRVSREFAVEYETLRILGVT